MTLTAERPDALAPPRVGHRYHVRAEQHPHEWITFTAWCRRVDLYEDGSVETEWDNGVIMRQRGALYYPNDPWAP